MKYVVEIETETEHIDSAIFQVYLDVKKKVRLTKDFVVGEEYKTTCNCSDAVKYRITSS